MRHADSTTLFEQGDHKYIMPGWEEQEEEVAVQTNQYVVSPGGEVVLLDPGGARVFPRILANVKEIRL